MLTTVGLSTGGLERRPRVVRLVVEIIGALFAVGCGGASVPGPAALSPSPVATMGELMTDVVLPTSDAVFYVSSRTPTTSEEWSQLQGQALMLAESANLLMMPGYAHPESQWASDARLMLDAGRAAYSAAKARDLEALEALSDPLYESCLTCHEHYRDEPVS